MHPTAAPAARPRERAHILIAEDSPLSAAVIRRTLVAEGHAVSVAGDGRAALEALEADPTVDLLLTDGEMPRLDGFGLCRAARRDARLRGLPIIFLTAEDGRVVEALDAGADDHLPKPFGEDELRARVRAALRMRTLRGELEAQRDLSQALIASLQDGLAVFSATGEILQVNDRLIAITGFGRDELVGARPPYPFWPPELREGYAQRLAQAFATGGGVEAERAYLHRDGSRRAVLVSLAPLAVTDRSGAAFVSTVKDATARLAAEEELRRSDALHRALAQEQAALGRVAAAAAASPPPEEIAALVCREAAGHLGTALGVAARYDSAGTAVVVASWASPDLGSVAAGTRLTRTGDRLGAEVLGERRGSASDGHRGEAEGRVPPALTQGPIVTAPVTAGGAAWGLLVLAGDGAGDLPHDAGRRLGDFAALLGLAVASAEARAELVQLAATDPLTGLANRRGFDARLAQEVARAERTGAPLSVVALDLDHFKLVNDALGHEVGDAALRALADRIASAARRSDIVARTGGEEFAWVLPGADLAIALAAAERLRLRVAAEPLGPAGRQTVSAGVAQARPREDAASLLRRADARLYDAKRGGRDRVVGEAPAPAATAPRGAPAAPLAV